MIELRPLTPSTGEENAQLRWFWRNVRVACPHLVQTRVLPENVLEHLYLTYVPRENRSAAKVTRVGVVCQSADNP
jgi:hypothetical protein